MYIEFYNCANDNDDDDDNTRGRRGTTTTTTIMGDVLGDSLPIFLYPTTGFGGFPLHLFVLYNKNGYLFQSFST